MNPLVDISLLTPLTRPSLPLGLMSCSRSLRPLLSESLKEQYIDINILNNYWHRVWGVQENDTITTLLRYNIECKFFLRNYSYNKSSVNYSRVQFPIHTKALMITKTSTRNRHDVLFFGENAKFQFLNASCFIEEIQKNSFMCSILWLKHARWLWMKHRKP